MKVIQILIAYCILLLSVGCSKSSNSSNSSVTLSELYKFNVSDFEFTKPREIPGMISSSPSGEIIKVNSHYVSKGNKPWIPSFGEFQYSRYPAEHWEDAILKMKSQGFYGISCYVFWIHHEEVEGEWNFEGRMNLRHFLQLCKKHHMGVFMRIGPWVNSECRNGGHPDWLLKKYGDPENPLGHHGTGGKLRKPTPEYLGAVDKLYYQLSKQMKGLYWKDGGPIFAIQIDNEYTPKHSGVGGTEIIEKEKEMALKYGMNVPIWTTTAWNGAEYIQDHTIPVHGSYGDYFWGSAKDYYRTPAYSFSNMRAVDDIDTEENPMSKNEIYSFEEYNNNPYMTCETGIGINIAYHRRPHITAKDNGAISLVELGSGCNGMGYFMNLGGNNPVGKHSYFNRSHKFGSMGNPVISNDFQGAIGEFGQIRESFYEYPVQLNFMADFGEYLAPCRTFVPSEIDEMQGKDLLNSLELQRALRTDGHKGFLFVNNHVKHDTAYQFNNVQFNLKLKSEELLFPDEPINVPVGSYFYWPFNLNLSGTQLKYATAQPVMYLKESNAYVFFKNNGINAEFVFDTSNVTDIIIAGGSVKTTNASYKLQITEAGLNCYFDVILNNGKVVKYIVLTEDLAKKSYKYNNTVYISNAEVLLFNQNKLELISERLENKIWMYPKSNLKESKVTNEGLFEKTTVVFDKVMVDFVAQKVQDGEQITYKNDISASGNNVGVPEDSVFNRGTIYELSFPGGIPSNLYDVRVNVNYKGSALRFYKNGRFTYDNYYNTMVWVLSTRHLLQDYSKDMKLELKFLPLQPLDEIYIAGTYWPNLQLQKNVLEVKKMEAIPVHSMVLNMQ